MEKVIKKVALYCRVSTENQEKNETIENQLADLYKVYDEKDIFKVYIDNPASGADLDRKGLNELRKNAQKGLFNVIGIWAGDRLARDVRSALVLRDEFKEAGIKVEIMGKERDDSDTGKLFNILEATMDEIERERIKRRSLAGKRRRLDEKKLIGCYPPYGYNHIKRDREKGIDAYFEINELEAFIVRKIFDLYLKFESIFLVTKELRMQGIKTRGKGGSPSFFQISTVSKILKRETYIGNFYYGKSSPCLPKYHIKKIRKTKLTGRRINPVSEWKMIKVPAIIGDEKFKRVKNIMAKRAKFKIRRSKYDFLCQGLLKCFRCGRAYGGKVQNKGYLLYRCSQAYGTNFNESVCKSRSVSKNKLDNAIWNYVKELISDKDKIKKSVRILRGRRESDRDKNQKICDILLLEKNSLKIKKGKLLDLYLDDDASKESTKFKLNELDEKEKIIDNQVIEVRKDLESIDNINAVEKEVENICLSYEDKINNASNELKKFIVRKWIEEINIKDDGGIIIKVRVPEILAETTEKMSISSIVSYDTPYIKKGRNKNIALLGLLSRGLSSG